MKFALMIALMATSSCTLEKLFPSRVADGAARLTVNNLANLMLAANSLPSLDADRPECNLIDPFSGQPQLQSQANGLGKVSWFFKDCRYDFGVEGSTVETTSSCGTKKTKFFGKVSLSGKRTIAGILTGNEGLPVIPSGPDGIEFDFERVTFENYRVETEGQENIMTNNSGSIAFKVQIHLGKSRNDKFCMVPLPNLTLMDIRYSPQAGAAESIVTLPGIFGQFQTAIDKSNLHAQVGVYAPNNVGAQVTQNRLYGSISVWGDNKKVTTDDTFRLDPALNDDAALKAFDSALGCIDQLELPYPPHCSFEQEAGTAIAQMTTYNLGHLLRAVADPKWNTNNPSTPNRKECNLGGLLNPTHLPKDVKTGEVFWEFDNCVFDFGKEGTLLEFTDEGKKTQVKFSGKATVTGRRSVYGLLTGNTLNPVVPQKGEMRFIFEKVEFENFRVVGEKAMRSLTLTSGSVKVGIIVHLEKAGEFDILQRPGSNLTFEDVSFSDGSQIVLSVRSGDYSGDFKLQVAASNFRAQNEAFGDDENTIEGSINMFGGSISIPKQKLNPDHEASIEKEKSAHFQRDSESATIGVEKYLASSLTRLSILNAAHLIGALLKKGHPPTDRSRKECFLAELDRVNGHTEIIRENSTEGKVVWKFKDCEYDFGPNETSIQIDGDPNKRPVKFSGKVKMSGERSIYGYLTGNRSQPVVPKTGELKLRLDNVTFERFKVDKAGSEAMLVIESGSARFQSTIHIGINKETKLFTEPLENLTFENFEYSNGSRLTALVSTGEFFGPYKIQVEGSHFDAQVGEHAGKNNEYSGTFNIYGSQIEVSGILDEKEPSESRGNGMDKGVHEHNSLEYFEAIMVARLLILNLATITKEANSESLKGKWWPSCGFSSSSIRRNPSLVEGAVGAIGKMEFSVKDCLVIDQSQIAYIPSLCTPQIQTAVTGQVKVSGVQTIRGEREKILFYYDSIIPRDPQSVRFDFSTIEPTNFSSYWRYDGSDYPLFDGQLKLVSGAFSAQVVPVTAARKSLPFSCKFDQSTPVAEFQIKDVRDLTVTLQMQYKGQPFFKSKTLKINAAHLTAKNGFYQGEGNYVEGFIEIDGVRFEFEREHDVLRLDYSQEQFDAEYRCRLYTEDDNSIHQLIKPELGFDATLGCPTF